MERTAARRARKSPTSRAWCKARPEEETASQTGADVQRDQFADSIRLAKRGLRIGRTSVGKGVFTTKRFVDGACIGEIEGTVIEDDDYVSRYAFDIGAGLQLEPKYPFRFVNHSCEPNCAFENFSFPRGVATTQQNTDISLSASSNSSTHRKLLLFSICDISVGEELTIDYNWPADFAIPCGCRTPGCRGWIVTPKDLPQVNRNCSTKS